MAAVMVSKAARGGGCGSWAGQGDAVAGGGCPEVGEQGGGALEVFVGDMAAAVVAGGGDGLDEGAGVGEVVHGSSLASVEAGPDRTRTVPQGAAAGGSAAATRWLVPRNSAESAARRAANACVRA
jgi:hypothetical protein